jgi:hypothetical protein
MTEYFLYVGQDSNFQSRTMLIPLNKMPSHIKELITNLKKYILRDCTDKSCTDKEGCTVSPKYNIVINNFISDDNNKSWSAECPEKGQVCCRMNRYADGDEDYVNDEWMNSSFFNLVPGCFNHLKNYEELLKITEYNNTPICITDHILVLESIDGKLNPSKWDTNEEMMKELYPLQYCIKNIK